MKFKLVEDWDFSVETTDAEVTFRRELDMYKKVFFSQPLYLMCPQFAYEVEIPTEKLEELLNIGSLKIKNVYEDAELDISVKQKEALPKIKEDYDTVSDSTPIVLDVKKPQKADGNKLVIHLPKNTNQGTDLLPADTDGRLCEVLYWLDGINAYRAEVPLYLLNDCLKKGAITQFPNSNSDLMFQKLKSKFQEHCRVNDLPYTSWINE